MPIAAIYGPNDLTPAARGNVSAPTSRHERPGATGDTLPMPSLEWNEEVARATAHLYDRVRSVIPPVEWPYSAE